MDLITGGTGLVGAHVLLESLADGRPVRAIHRAGSDRDIVRRVFLHYRPDGEALFAKIEWMQADLLDVQGMREAMQGVRRVFHCAALVSFDPRDTNTLFAVNITGTANVVNAALENDVQVLVHASSTGALGRSRHGRPVDETDPFVRDRHTSPYAISKHEAEFEVHRGIAEGLRGVIVNPALIFGAGARGRSSLSSIERLSRGTRFFPPGSNGVVDARDVATMMVLLADKGETGGRYVLSGGTLGYRDLFACAAEAFGDPAPRTQLPTWVLGVAWRAERVRAALLGGRSLITRHTVHSAISLRDYRADKVKALLGMEFRTPKEAIRNAVEFFRKERALH